MSWYRRAKLAIDAFRNLNRFASTQQPIRNLSHLSGKPPLTSSLISQSRNPNLVLGRRNYYVDRNEIHHFAPRGPKRWFQNRRNIVTVIVVGSGVGISLYYGNIETVPYTKRRHFVLLSPNLEKQLGEKEFDKLKKSFQGRILPAIHPVSVRVRLIAEEVIQALQRGVRQETVWTDPSYVSQSSGESDDSARGAVRDLVQDVEGVDRDHWNQDEEVLDDRWVQKSRKKAQERGRKAATKHLEKVNWEVLVVDQPLVNAFCLPGGKIVVFTGLLQHFKTDAEIATILGHEVAHAVARHSAEGITKNMWVAIIQIILLQFVSMPDLVNAMSNLLLKLPFSRRMEIEADYIGLLLIASAGYDPRIAPKVYEKLGEVGGDSPFGDYLSTHPSGKKRARLLAQAKVMEEAFTIYKDGRAGHLTEDFL